MTLACRLSAVLGLSALLALIPACDSGDGGGMDMTGGSGWGAGDDDPGGVAQAACVCGDRVCGEDPCGNVCGTCEGAGEYCFGGTCQTEASCPPVDFTVGTQTAYRMDDKGKERLRFEADVTGSDFTRLEIVSNRVIEEIGSLSKGIHSLSVDSLTACDDVCVVAHMDCNKQKCAFPYIATMGTLSLKQAGPAAERLMGSASDLVFTQAYYDESSRQYQILKKADSVCMPGFAFDAALDQIVIEPTECTPEGTGNTPGSEIADFAMVNCLGDEVQLHDNCGYEALWIIAVADW